MKSSTDGEEAEMSEQQIDVRMYLGGSAYTKTIQVDAKIYGAWAVHRTLDSEISQYDDADWTITHVPSGALAFVGHDRDAMIEAAKRLNQHDQPSFGVSHNGALMPSVKGLSVEWANSIVPLLNDLDVYATGSGRMLRIDEAAKRLAGKSEVQP